MYWSPSSLEQQFTFTDRYYKWRLAVLTFCSSALLITIPESRGPCYAFHSNWSMATVSGLKVIRKFVFAFPLSFNLSLEINLMAIRTTATVYLHHHRCRSHWRSQKFWTKSRNICSSLRSPVNLNSIIVTLRSCDLTAAIKWYEIIINAHTFCNNIICCDLINSNWPIRWKPQFSR